MSRRRLASADDFVSAVGEPPGRSDWMEVDQRRIDLLPKQPVTISGSTSMSRRQGTDHSAARSPTAISRSHSPVLMRQAISIDSGMAVNYGLDRVRLIKPSPRREPDPLARRALAGGS